MANKQTYCRDAVVKLDGIDLGDRANALLAKKVESNKGGCDEVLTHVFIGDSDACDYAARAVAEGSDEDFDAPACGKSGENAVLVRCADLQTMPRRIGTFAVAAHENSPRNPQGALIVKELLLTAETNRSKWDDLFRRSFEQDCDQAGVARNKGKENTNLVNAKVTVDGVEILTDVRGQVLLARNKKDPRPTPDDCGKEELTHVFIGDKDACIYEAKQVAAGSNGDLFGPACGRSGHNAEVILCTKKGVASHSQGKFAVACHKDSERDIEGTLIVKDLLLTNKKPTDWSDLFRESFLANCPDND